MKPHLFILFVPFVLSLSVQGQGVTVSAPNNVIPRGDGPTIAAANALKSQPSAISHEDTNTPAPIEPRIITPGPVGGPPSDAIVLFDGKDLSKWKNAKGADATWTLGDGYFEVKPGAGNMFTKEEFGDIQLHVEWMSPSPAKGEGQNRGNSGIYFQGRYEIQVLDSYENKTYFNGQAGALYGISQPLVNACRPPGEWQTYDITFHPAKPADDGKIQPGSISVLHNGVLVQDHTEVAGKTTAASAFKDAAAMGPLMLQDHGHKVRFRNIWVRRL